MRQLPLAIAVAPARSLDSFIAGPNGALLAHLAALHAPGAPLYLWGPEGCGKTHLLTALASRWQHQGAQVAWFDALTAPPWSLPGAGSLLLLDDCEAWDVPRQQAAFALLVEAIDHGVQWAAASRLPPVDLPLREDLRTRLAWGHVYAMQPLGEEHARAALRQEADLRGVFLGDEVMDYLLTRFERNLKHLMQLLHRLDEFAVAEQRALTVPLLKKMLNDGVSA